jgi:hypothetical protein
MLVICDHPGEGLMNPLDKVVVGDKAHHNIVGPYRLGRRNQRGQMLIDFFERNGLVITNTWFKTPKRRLYTWKSLGDRSLYQLDYVLVKQ